MKKRILALALCFVTLLLALPAAANATVLTGMTSKVDYANTDPNRYWIEVDLVNQVITVYEGGAIALQSLCTTGSDKYPTGSGVFKLGHLKERFGYFVAFGQYAQYWTQVVRGVYIHSIMYDSQKLSSLSSSAYKNLGKNVSHGCIRVPPDVAEWIFYNCPPDTTCNIVKNKPRDTALTKALKSGMSSYKYYSTYTDAKGYPAEIPAAVLYDNVPLRSGFSASKDKTLLKLAGNEKVTLLQIGPDWCKVRTQSGKLGYVQSAYLLCYPDAPIETHEAYAATGRTYLYERTSTEAERLVRIAKGAEIAVTGNPKKGWYSAVFDGMQGFVRTKYVKLTQSVTYPTAPGYTDAATQTPAAADPALQLPAEPGAAPAAATPAAGSTRVRSDLNANMRSGPGTAYQLIFTIPAGTPVTVKGVEGSWFYCEALGYTGYIAQSCITR